MSRLLTFIIIFVLTSSAYSAAITFPEFNAYSEINDSCQMKSSYLIDMLFDTGLKYGLTVGLGFKNYNITSLNSNFATLSGVKVYAKPFDLFYTGYFLGKNTTLGYSEFGYRGFQYHQEPNLEYIGYKDVTGSGVEAYMGFFDEMFVPHVYLYQPSDTNMVSLDGVFYIKMDTYTIELYTGINNIDLLSAISNNTLAKRFGIFIKTVFSKVDFQMGLYSPDTKLSDPLVADSFYLNVTERINISYFEQTLSVFARPTFYNGYKEKITNDVDFYLALGVRIDDFGAGIENSVMYNSVYSLSDRIGLYSYFYIDNLQYKVGFYYTPIGLQLPSKYGAFISIVGNI